MVNHAIGTVERKLVEAERRLSVAVPVAMLLIFLLLYFALEKLKYGLLIFSAIPLSAVGGVQARWLRGMPLRTMRNVGKNAYAVPGQMKHAGDAAQRPGPGRSGRAPGSSRLED